jgi:protein-S-isoprenylcysteine O-methyltransferase Ste14
VADQSVNGPAGAEPGKPPEAQGIAGAPWRAVARFLVSTMLVLGILFVSAGRLDWWEGWAYVAVTLFVLVLSRAIMIVRNPDMVRERATAAGRADVKAWDKVLVPLIAVYGPIAAWVVAGLDERFGWTPDLPDRTQLIALGLIFLGSMLATWAMSVNRFFSSQVRLQVDRGHTVVSAGPYRVVRHPGYAGGILAWAASPVYFASFWVAVPAAAVIALTVVRTALEDRMLQAELPGYDQYARRVRHRLVPGIW